MSHPHIRSAAFLLFALGSLRGLALVGFVGLVACGAPEHAPESAAESQSEAQSEAQSEVQSEAQTQPWFEEASGRLGLDFVHRSGAEGDLLFPEIMSGGVALLDADSDGDLDVFFVQGHTARGHDTRDELWRNDLVDRDVGDDDLVNGRRFSRVEDWLDGASPVNGFRYGMGAAVGDVDGDGDLDLFVANAGRDALLRNDSRDGTIRFTDVTGTAGVGGDEGWSSSAGFFDADGDGDLDLFVTRYVHWTPASDLDCAAPSGRDDYCSPTSYSAPLPDLLYRNEGLDASGHVVFREISLEAGLRRVFGNGLGLAFLDLDLDDDLDVFVANDQTPNQLWRNLGDGTFRDVAPEMGTAVGLDGEERAGMGVAMSDLDDDGDSEILVVNLERQADTLLRNEGAFFRDVTAALGLGIASRRYTRFGVGFADFDLDGRLDLYVANGRVTLPSRGVPAEAVPSGDPFAEQNLLFAGTPDGRFELVPGGGTATPQVAASRAAAFGDLDGDGGLDVVVVNRDERAHLLRNLHPDREGHGHWLLLDLVDGSGRSTVGATVTVHWNGRRLHRRLAPASSYQTSHDPRVHFGLGPAGPAGADAPAAHVEIRWPDGTVQDVGSLAVDRLHVVRRSD